MTYLIFYIPLSFIAAAIGAVFGVMDLLWWFERKRRGY